MEVNKINEYYYWLGDIIFKKWYFLIQYSQLVFSRRLSLNKYVNGFKTLWSVVNHCLNVIRHMIISCNIITLEDEWEWCESKRMEWLIMSFPKEENYLKLLEQQRLLFILIKNCVLFQSHLCDFRLRIHLYKEREEIAL